jgi:hypothetical protein
VLTRLPLLPHLLLQVKEQALTQQLADLAGEVARLTADCQGHELVLMQQVRENRDLQLPCSYHAATMQLPRSCDVAAM